MKTKEFLLEEVSITRNQMEYFQEVIESKLENIARINECKEAIERLKSQSLELNDELTRTISLYNSKLAQLEKSKSINVITNASLNRALYVINRKRMVLESKISEIRHSISKYEKDIIWCEKEIASTNSQAIAKQLKTYMDKYARLVADLANLAEKTADEAENF